MDGWLRQSTAVTVPIGPFVDSTDGDAEEAALTIAQADVRLSKNGAASAQKNNATSASHDADGVYLCPFSTTDTNTLGQLVAWVHVAGALFAKHVFHVVPAQVWDSLFGSDLLQVDAREYVGVTGVAGAIPAVAAGANGGLPLGNAAGAVTLANATHTGAVIPTVTNLTNAPTAGDLTATMKASINTEVDAALDTAIPGSPTANSINERIQTMDNAYTATRAGYLDNLSAGAVALASSLATLAGKFTGITLLAEWLGLIAGKQVGNTTARTEMRATGAGSGTYDETTDSLEALKDDQMTAVELENAVWDATAADHNDVGSTGEALLDAGGAGTPPTAAEVADAVWDEALSGHTTAGTAGERLGRVPNAAAGGNGGLPTVDANNRIAGLQGTKHTLDDLTDLTQANVRTAMGMASANMDTQLGNIYGKVDTEVQAIIDALALVQADTDDIQARLPAALVGGRMDSNASAINNVAAAAVRLALSAGQIIPFTVDHTGSAATTTEFESDDLTTATADHWNTRLVIFTSGTLAGQVCSITDYALAGGRGHFTISAATSAPADNVTGIII